MNSITIELPLPPKELHPNGGRHHNRFKIARLVRERKQSAWGHTINALNGRTVDWPGAVIDYTLYLRQNAKLADDDNATSWMKPYRDGIATALGINDKHFRTGKVSFAVDKARPRVVITISAEGRGR